MITQEEVRAIVAEYKKEKGGITHDELREEILKHDSDMGYHDVDILEEEEVLQDE